MNHFTALRKHTYNSSERFPKMLNGDNDFTIQRHQKNKNSIKLINLDVLFFIVVVDDGK